MMITQKDVLYAAERRRDDMAFAQRQRLISQVMRADGLPHKRYRYWLARLGKQLVSWGCHLQERYADALTLSSTAQQGRYSTQS
jgi:hypothetical protein